jgi:ferritin
MRENNEFILLYANLCGAIMLKKEMIDQLNEQLNLEFYSANLYLQMSAWCSDKGFEGAAAFLMQHSQEEMEHMHRLFKYVSDTGALPLLGAIAAPPVEFESLSDVFQQTYEHEQHITTKINELADLAMTLKDYSSFNFLQWYVAEQHEEETLFKSVLDKLGLVSNTGNGLFFVDKDLKGMVNQGPST